MGATEYERPLVTAERSKNTEKKKKKKKTKKKQNIPSKKNLLNRNKSANKYTCK